MKQEGTAQIVTLGARCLLGRHPACDVRVEDPRVSGEHASVHWIGDRWELRDLGSRNGTFVDGRRLSAGGRTTLFEGVTFSLGGPREGFTLVDSGPPVACARAMKSGRLRAAVGGLLVLPDDDDPKVSVFQEGEGAWVIEAEDTTRAAADQEVVIVGGEVWTLQLPRDAGVTWEPSATGLLLEMIHLHLAVSRDEEHVEVTMIHEGKATQLRSRSHHYLLLTLARARLADGDARPEDRGWLDRASICRMLATDLNKLNVDVFRVRKEFTALGVLGAAGIITRRPDSGQIRLGIDRVEVVTL